MLLTEEYARYVCEEVKEKSKAKYAAIGAAGYGGITNRNYRKAAKMGTRQYKQDIAKAMRPGGMFQKVGDKIAGKGSVKAARTFAIKGAPEFSRTMRAVGKVGRRPATAVAAGIGALGGAALAAHKNKKIRRQNAAQAYEGGVAATAGGIARKAAQGAVNVAKRHPAASMLAADAALMGPLGYRHGKQEVTGKRPTWSDNKKLAVGTFLSPGYGIGRAIGGIKKKPVPVTECSSYRNAVTDIILDSIPY